MNMGLAAKKPCNKPCCPDFQIAGSRYCAKHSEQVKQEEYAERANDEVRKLYHTARWRRFKTQFFTLNWQCQRIKDGVRCPYPASLIHHRRSPRENLDLMFEETNCVGLCTRCHHGHPGDKPDDVFAPTLLEFEERYESEQF
jgi:hypothetical protein